MRGAPASWARERGPRWAPRGREQLPARRTSALARPFGAGAEGEACWRPGARPEAGPRVRGKGSGLGRERGAGQDRREAGPREEEESLGRDRSTRPMSHNY